MNLTDAKVKKSELEASILEQLKAFEAETGLTVESVTHSRAGRMGEAGPEEISRAVSITVTF